MTTDSGPLTLTSVVSQTPTQVHVEVNGTTVILSMASNAYFSLTEVGSTIWTLLRQPVTVQELCTAVMARYEVDAARCERDTLDLVADLLAAGLVVRR